ncbi:MAG TPA: hypothetical protein VFD32_11785 [Dehalococcoidia bacterium]|nr:hypothetical protein [Dehalococcoidia bacterium]
MAGQSTPGCFVFVPLAKDRRDRTGSGRGAPLAARAANGVALLHHY